MISLSVFENEFHKFQIYQLLKERKLEIRAGDIGSEGPGIVTGCIVNVINGTFCMPGRDDYFGFSGARPKKILYNLRPVIVFRQVRQK